MKLPNLLITSLLVLMLIPISLVGCSSYQQQKSLSQDDQIDAQIKKQNQQANEDAIREECQAEAEALGTGYKDCLIKNGVKPR